MNTLLVIITLCGNPVYIVAQDTQGPLIGEASSAPKPAIKRLLDLASTPDTLIIKKPLEELIGSTGSECS